MFQLTEFSPERSDCGAYYLVSETGEHGPYETYDDAIDAAEHPQPDMIGFNPHRGYFVVDRSDPDVN